MKIIYNITTIVDHSKKEEWLQWVDQDLIPQINESGLFFDVKLMRIIDREYNPDGSTYALQLFAESFHNCRTYELEYLPKISEDESSKFSGKLASFTTFMELM